VTQKSLRFRWPPRRGQTFLRVLDIKITFTRQGRAGNRIIRMSVLMKVPSAPSATFANRYPNRLVTSATTTVALNWSAAVRILQPPRLLARKC
jgi:hypothetical protein